MRVEVEPGIRLFVDVVGSGLAPTDAAMLPKPTLLLLHGGPGFDHSGFRPYFDRFADTHQVLYVDQRGQGRSDGHDDPTRWNFDTWADDVVRLCAALEIDTPVVLGNSFGGFVAMHCARAIRITRRSWCSPARRRAATSSVSAARFEALGGPEARDCYLRVFDGDPAPADGIEYLQRCIPLYNRTSSPFGPARSMLNVEMMADSTRWFAGLDLRHDLRAVARPHPRARR